ncbi:MAG: hypothetical protein LR015_00350 [Verrucomicrobia bacterium]|nr:hypothetical protein [Verrucomicrobiota bacterium]
MPIWFWLHLLASCVTFLAYLLLPVSFAVGQTLLHGPTGAMFTVWVNAPVTAWFGFDYYALTGGIPLALLIGLALGYAGNRALQGFRKRMISLESGENRFKTWSQKRWVKVIDYIIIGPGSKGALSWEALGAKKVGNPVRPLGVGLVVVAAVFVFLVGRFFQEPILTPLVRDGLARVNGATVDLASVQIRWSEARVELHGLAMADRNDLQRNLIASERISGSLSLVSALRRTLVVDELVVHNARQGEPRATMGRLIEPRGSQRQTTPLEIPDFDTLERWVRDAALWRQRLQQAQDLLERFGGDAEAGDGFDETGLTLRERLRLRADSLGYANVRAEHLRVENPTLTIRNLTAGGVRTTWLPDELIDIQMHNLSSHPALLAERPTLNLRSAEATVLLDLIVGSSAAALPHQVNLALKNLSADAVGNQIQRQGRPLFQGGTMDVTANGTLSALDSQMPLQVTFAGTTFFIGSDSGTEIRSLTLPIEFRGPLAHPSVRLSDDALQRALRQAGQDRLLREVENRIPTLPFPRR